MLVKSNLCTFLALTGSYICAINIWNSFPFPIIFYDNNTSISEFKTVHKISYQ